MNIQPAQFTFAGSSVNMQPSYTTLSGGIVGGAPPTPPERKPFLRTRERLLAKIRREDPVRAEKLAAMPLIAGAAKEAETDKTVELIHRKKIILKRNVTTQRSGVKNGTPTHSGTVELVRTLSGNTNETGTIGVKATGDNSGHVEIPIEDLLAAVEELRDSV